MTWTPVELANCSPNTRARWLTSTEDATGQEGIGAAFHVGEGVFVTAKHVVEGRVVKLVGSTETTYVALEGPDALETKTLVGKERIPSHTVRNEQMSLSAGPFLHAHEGVDVAVFQVESIDPYTPVVQLGDHLDDWLGESDFVLSGIVLLGYPPIPLATRPHLFGARAEINAMVDLANTPHVHFIASSMPRGGFSGGVALSEAGFVVGMVTQSLVTNHAAEELGFMGILGVQAIYECLADFKLLPDRQAERWDGFWNTTHLDFFDPTDFEIEERRDCERPASDGLLVADVGVYDDGKRFALEIMVNNDEETFASALAAANVILKSYEVDVVHIRAGMQRLNLRGEVARSDVAAAARAAVAIIAELGYRPDPLARDWPFGPASDPLP